MKLHDLGYTYPEIYDLTLIDLHRIMDASDLKQKFQNLESSNVSGYGRYQRLQEWKRKKKKIRDQRGAD